MEIKVNEMSETESKYSTQRDNKVKVISFSTNWQIYKLTGL